MEPHGFGGGHGSRAILVVKLVMPLADAYVTCPTAYSIVTLIFEVLCEIRKVKETLGLRRSCSDEEIKQAYRALALKMPSCTWKERGHWAMTYKKGEDSFSGEEVHQKLWYN